MFIQKKQNDKTILKFLYKYEPFFVEEISNFEKSIFIGKGNDGWLILPAPCDTADWNIVRNIGNAEIAMPMLWYAINTAKKAGNEKNIHIIVDNPIAKKYSECFFILKKEKSLFLYSSPNQIKADAFVSPFHFTINKSQAILNFNDEFAGLISFTSFSNNYADLHIEINHKYRNNGLGKKMLLNAAQKMNEKKIKLVYWVEEDNLASLKTAIGANFIKLQKYDVFTL